MTQTTRIQMEIFGRTTNLPPNDGVGEALTKGQERVDHISKWYKDATGGNNNGDISDTRWDDLVELEATAILIRRYRSPQDAAVFRATEIDPFMAEVASTYAADWGSGYGATDAITPGSLRKSVVSYLIRKKEPVFPPLSEVDAAIQQEFIMLWEARKWRFRRKPEWLHINVDGSVSSAESYSFDGIASKVIYIKDPSTKQVTTCEWRDSTKFAELMARYSGEVNATGSPKHFYLQPDGKNMKISFLPEPDKEYDAFATVYLSAPSLGGSNDSETGLKDLPVSFRMHLRDRIIARIVHESSSDGPEANRFIKKVQNDYLTLLAEFDDTGSNEWNISYHDSGKWAGGFRSGRGRYLGGYG